MKEVFTSEVIKFSVISTFHVVLNEILEWTAPVAKVLCMALFLSGYENTLLYLQMILPNARGLAILFFKWIFDVITHSYIVFIFSLQKASLLFYVVREVSAAWSMV